MEINSSNIKQAGNGERFYSLALIVERSTSFTQGKF